MTNTFYRWGDVTHREGGETEPTEKELPQVTHGSKHLTFPPATHCQPTYINQTARCKDTQVFTGTCIQGITFVSFKLC